MAGVASHRHNNKNDKNQLRFTHDTCIWQKHTENVRERDTERDRSCATRQNAIISTGISVYVFEYVCTFTVRQTSATMTGPGDRLRVHLLCVLVRWSVEVTADFLVAIIFTVVVVIAVVRRPVGSLICMPECLYICCIYVQYVPIANMVHPKNACPRVFSRFAQWWRRT